MQCILPRFVKLLEINLNLHFCSNLLGRWKAYNDWFLLGMLILKGLMSDALLVIPAYEYAIRKKKNTI